MKPDYSKNKSAVDRLRELFQTQTGYITLDRGHRTECRKGEARSPSNSSVNSLQQDLSYWGCGYNELK